MVILGGGAIAVVVLVEGLEAVDIVVSGHALLPSSWG